MRSTLIIVGMLAVIAAAAVFFGIPFYRKATTPVITGDGDSLMANGVALQRLNDDLGGGFELINVAAVGNRVGTDLAGRQMPRPFKLPGTRRVVWLIGGTNDLAFSTGGPDVVERLLKDVEAYFRRLNERGYPADACLYTDLLPRSGIPDPTFEADRILFNSLVRERLKGLATVVDSGSDPRLQDPMDKEWYTDGTHLTSRGSQLLADDAFRALNSGDQ